MPTATDLTITREDLNPCTVKLTVVCGEDLVKEGFNKAYKQLSKRIRVPGFRPGQAPRKMVEEMIPKEEAYDAAAEAIVQSAFKSAMEREGLTPHGTPSVAVRSLDEATSSCEFELKVPLAPIVDLTDYKSLSAQRPVVEVADAEIEHQIDEMRRRRSTREKVTDRGVQEGDVAVVNIKLDGEEGDGRNFMTVAGQTFPQLDEALLGMKVEELKSLELTFPENFQEKDWATKTFKTQVTLRSLNAVKLPDVQVVVDALNIENADALRERVRESLAIAKANMSDEYVSEQLLEQLVSRSTVHVPDTMWEQVANRRLSEIAEEQRRKGKSMEDYAADQGMTMEQLVEAWRAEAKMYVQRAVLIQEIFGKEKLQLTNEDLNRELIVMAQEFQVEPAELLEQLKKNQAIEELHFRAVTRKVVELLRSSATLTDVRME